jgi:hypothetical protein
MRPVKVIQTRARTGGPPGSRLQRPTMKVDTLSSNWNLARIPR